MYLISDRELARSTINDRLHSIIYKNAGLEERLCKLASATNNARHRSVADGKRMSAADHVTVQIHLNISLDPGSTYFIY